ncbi:ATP-grasp fold amidoligase family protein [Thetidibacter halocola]|uniref:Glycosyl transferase n=1 Tax=Thetidibacter halocola TaxID=2827239 RepID=A0A8J7WG22_9RHOB|nr:ATP-grasp fold amidoligase family protein [Thetidibacter halocola]MBS0124408.1 hypothetical protein [Thetidibacter halocola]
MHFQKPFRRRSALQDWLVETREQALARLDALAGYPHLRRMFRERVGYEPNLKTPKTYNEKVQWRKINDRNPLFPIVSDKLRLRGYVQDLLGPDAADILPRLHLATDDPDRIDFAALPANVVFKANHGSGWNIFLREGEPRDEDRLREEMRRWLRRSYAVRKHEWAYQHIPRRIIAEEMIQKPDSTVPDDLKFSMFRDQCGFIFWDDDRFGSMTQHICDDTWTELPWSNADLDKGILPPKPILFERMLDVARRIGAQFDMVRVDFLFTDERIVLNELTLYRGSGMMPYSPPEWDRHYGDMWTLPDL